MLSPSISRAHLLASIGRARALLVSIVALGVLGCGPIGPLPGGRLSGEVGPPDASDWSAVAQEQTLHLETRPEDPHSVNTWFVVLGPRLYVPTSMIRGPKDPAERDWVANVQADPNVRLRIDGIVYERTAKRVEAGAEYDDARAALEKKYKRDPEDRDPERVIWIFRMDPRRS